MFVQYITIEQYFFIVNGVIFTQSVIIERDPYVLFIYSYLFINEFLVDMQMRRVQPRRFWNRRSDELVFDTPFVLTCKLLVRCLIACSIKISLN